MKETKFEEVTLKNVLAPNDTESDVTVQVVPFNRRNDAHTDFAYGWIDCLNRMPSTFTTANEAARRYVQLFMVHDENDESNENSTYARVLSDIRACRTLFNIPTFQKALSDFFANA